MVFPRAVRSPPAASRPDVEVAQAVRNMWFRAGQITIAAKQMQISHQPRGVVKNHLRARRAPCSRLRGSVWPVSFISLAKLAVFGRPSSVLTGSPSLQLLGCRLSNAGNVSRPETHPDSIGKSGASLHQCEGLLDASNKSTLIELPSTCPTSVHPVLIAGGRLVVTTALTPMDATRSSTPFASADSTAEIVCVDDLRHHAEMIVLRGIATRREADVCHLVARLQSIC